MSIPEFNSGKAGWARVIVLRTSTVAVKIVRGLVVRFVRLSVTVAGSRGSCRTRRRRYMQKQTHTQGIERSDLSDTVGVMQRVGVCVGAYRDVWSVELEDCGKVWYLQKNAVSLSWRVTLTSLEVGFM